MTWTPGSLQQRVSEALDELRPALRMDGGDAELVEIAGDVVKVRLLGACCSCPMAEVTLVSFVQERLVARVPEIRRVVSV